jgi:hypothetical protein
MRGIPAPTMVAIRCKRRRRRRSSKRRPSRQTKRTSVPQKHHAFGVAATWEADALQIEVPQNHNNARMLTIKLNLSYLHLY